jgi:GWxTD domain-containing protein
MSRTYQVQLGIKENTMIFLTSLIKGKHQGIKRADAALVALAYSSLLFLLTACGSSSQVAQKPTNVVYKYENNAPIQLKHTSFFNENRYTVYLSVNVRRLRSEGSVDAFKRNINLSYRQKQTFDGPDLVKLDSIPSSELSIQKKGEVFICQLTIPRISNFPPYLFVDVRDKRTDFQVSEEIVFETEGKSNFWSSILYNVTDSVPVFSKYILTGKQYRVYPEGKSLFTNYIKDEFPPAPAPMSSSSKPVSKKLTIDSIYSIDQGNLLSFDSTGLYLIQDDTTSATGLGFRVETGKYPKYTKISSLIKPLVYISTTEEIKTLNNNSDTKKALDNYWLKLGGNANDAKRLIKIFYDRVEAANEKFTSYKEGWKTDMGMIYIIFGEPGQVYHNGDQEQWIYEKSEGMSEVKFTFTKVKNIYTNNHYELIRYPEYEEYWYNKVDLWRKGTPGI